MFCTKKLMLASLPLFYPCLDSHIPLLCLHCTHTTEEAAFGITICTHVLQNREMGLKDNVED